MLKYRSDIDGLRAIAVLLVVLFHSGFTSFSAGFVGVDIFFVISGFLITQIIYKEIIDKTFTFSSFYKRRVVRLLPALNLTLLAVLLFSFITLDNKTFDTLGKETFFSALGLVNLHYAQGANYFEATDTIKPLIHLWSLGVEEQYYLAWPVLLLVLARFPKRLILAVTLVLLVVSLIVSEIAANGLQQTKAYYLPQYRAFELLIGSFTALVLHQSNGQLLLTHKKLRNVLFYVGFLLVTLPLFYLDKTSSFPGINAFWVCLGTALIISFPQEKSWLTSMLSSKLLVTIGLISYPLYLFHQPILFLLSSLSLTYNSTITFFLTMAISMPLAWLTYKKLEIPIRNNVRSGTRVLIIVWSLIGLLLLISVAGLFIAKSGGVPQRFKWLNDFAYQTTQVHQSTFHNFYGKGVQLNAGPASALFMGDSTLQNYVHPLKNTYQFEHIDTITRGGCVLLKGINFVDKFNDISCDDIRSKAYSSDKRYNSVFISQSWSSYQGRILNAQSDSDLFTRWDSFIKNTVEHFQNQGSQVYLITWHPTVNYNKALSPNLKLNKEAYAGLLTKQNIVNQGKMRQGTAHLTRLAEELNIEVIHPFDIFCVPQCTTHNNEWSFFSDEIHFTSEGSQYVEERLKQLRNEG